jgi:hypothetical protein
VRQWASDVERFEKWTYLDGFSDVAGDVDIGNDVQDRLPPYAFLWQFMLWDIRQRKRRRRVAMAFGFIVPALMLLAPSIFITVAWFTIAGHWSLNIVDNDINMVKRAIHETGLEGVRQSRYRL